MCARDESIAPLGDEEELYRRVPVSLNYYDPRTGRLEPDAFAPHRTRDTTGISVSRSRYRSVKEAARGRPGKSYYVAVLRVKDLRGHKIQVVPRPTEDNPGHAELPELRSENRKSSRVQELKRLLVELTVRVEGPFDTPEE